MNSDTPQPGPTPASPTPAPTRSSNLKGRWKRGPNPVTGATAASRPSAPANFGEVKDIASVKESLSGQHICGYEQGSAPATATVQVAAPTPAPAAPPPAPSTPRTESFAPRPQPATAPAQRPAAAANPPPSRPAPPPPSAEYIALREAQRAEAKQNPRPPQPARAPQPPRQAESSRPPQDNRGRGQDSRGGERENFVALKPDPANDPAPRRLRTESARPVPVEEYSPSNFGRGPDKSIPAKHEPRPERDQHSRKDRPSDKDRHSDKREAAPSSSSERLKPNATIPARISSSKTAKAKSGGIFGFIKKIFGDSSKERKMEKSSSALREDEEEHQPDDGDDGHDHRSHNRSSQGRHGDNRRSSGHRRSERR